MSAHAEIVKFYHNGEEPVFATPWEAHAFALTVRLHERGFFSWVEWSETLAKTIRLNDQASYYESWFRALESLVLTKGMIEANELLTEIEALKSDV